MQIDPVVKRVLQTALHSHNLLLNMPKKTAMPSKKRSKTQVPEASELEEVEIAQSETEEDPTGQTQKGHPRGPQRTYIGGTFRLV